MDCGCRPTMGGPSIFFSCRSPPILAARRVFVMDGPSPSPADALRTHLLRPWQLHVRLFANHDAARSWAAHAPAGITPDGQRRAAPASFRPSQGSFLRTFFGDEEALVDMSDPVGVSKFFHQLSGWQCADGVRVVGLALEVPAATDGPPFVANAETALHCGRAERHDASSHDAQPGQLLPRRHAASEQMSRSRTSAIGGINRVSSGSVAKGLRPLGRRGSRSVATRAAEQTPSGVAGWTGKAGGPSPPCTRRSAARCTKDIGGGVQVAGPIGTRPRVAWSYAGGADAAARLPVATLPTSVELPHSVVGAERRVCRLLTSGTNVFLTGPPGCGKTFMIKGAVKAMRETGLTVSVCGSSGVAAALVGGTTVHSWAGFINGDADVTTPLETVVAKVIPLSAKQRMCSAMVLVVDEVGTFSAAFLTRLDVVLRTVRRKPLPFGGLVVLCSGDFLQLAPPTGSFAFLSNVWREAFGARALVLDTYWRHVNDQPLLDVLLRMRVGNHNAADIDLLATRRSAKPPPSVIWLFCHSFRAKDKNEEELRRLPGPDIIYRAQDKVEVTYLTLSAAHKLLDEGLRMVRVLTLRLGAMVIVPSSCLSSQGVPSGARGVVVCFFWVGCMQYPTVRFELPTGGFVTVDVTPVVGKVVALDGIEVAASRKQLPLVLAWALTIHGAQGWTLPEVAVDLSHAWAAGQALSGLSRTPTLAGLHLVGFDEDKVIVDDVAVAFHESLLPY